MPAPAPRLQKLRDWIALALSISSLGTALLVWQGTMAGPRPELGDPVGEGVTILRSDQFRDSDGKELLPLLDSRNDAAHFPLVLTQVTLSNRAPSGQGTMLRRLDGELSLTHQASRHAYRLDLAWESITTSRSARDGQVERMRFVSIEQPAAFLLGGGGGWSREVLFAPLNRHPDTHWSRFQEAIAACPEESCAMTLTLRAHFADGRVLERRCRIPVEAHTSGYLAGQSRHFFTSEACARPSQ